MLKVTKYKSRNEVINMIHILEIFDRKSYNQFFEKYISEKNDIIDNYIGDEFIFKIKFNDENVDEQLLFDYYLIKKKYKTQATFNLQIYLSKIKEERSDIYFALSTYGFFQEQNEQHGEVIYENGKKQHLYTGGLKGLKRLVPVFDIDENNWEFLRCGIDKKAWEKIKNGQLESMNKFDSAVYRLCWRLLYSDVGNGNYNLSELRRNAFSDEKFYELIEGLPIIALLIFAILDYSYRVDAVEHYKNYIRKSTKLKTIKLDKKDFLYEIQSEQKRINFIANKQLENEGYDNKTIWTKEKEIIHPFIVKEIYEAITISEGVLQLIENIILHAGSEQNKGIGLLGLYIRNFEKDKNVLYNKYPQYIEFCERENIKSKYFLELLIGDLSGTDISHKFIDNNKSFLEEYKEEIQLKLLKSGNEAEVPQSIFLKDFFEPDRNKTAFWEAFFSFADKAINHYGLQIFDSIISTKGGLFSVESGNENYCNIEKIVGSGWPKGADIVLFFLLVGIPVQIQIFMIQCLSMIMIWKLTWIYPEN